MKHPVVAVIMGILSGSLLVFGIEAIAHVMFPVPVEMVTENLEEYMAKVPLANKMMVLFAHFLGVMLAVIVTLKLTKKKVPGYFTASLFFAFTVLNLFLVKHPIWFWIADIAILALGIYLSFKLASPKEGNQ